MSAGSIVIDLLLRSGAFETDTKRAEKRLRELQKEAVEVGKAIGVAFAAVGTAAAYMVKSSIDAMDEMSKQAQMVGITVEKLSGYAYAANLAGVSNEEMTAGLVRLSRSITEESEAFHKLGISVRNTDGTLKGADTVLEELADKFAKMPDGVDKTAAAVELLSRGGAKMIPWLNGGAAGLQDMLKEARALGVVLDTETSKAAEEFNDNLSRMGAAVTGVANRAATELLPALKSASQMLVDVAKDEATVEVATDTLKIAVGGLITVLQTFAVVGSNVGFVLTSIGREIGAWLAQAQALGVSFGTMLQGPAAIAAALATAAVKGESSWSQFSAISDAVKADAAKARAELDKFQARVMSLGQPGYRDPRLLGDVGSISSQTIGWGRPPAPPPAPAHAVTPPTLRATPYATSNRWDAVSAAAAEAEILNEAQEEWAKYAGAVDGAKKPLQDVAVAMTENQRLAEEFGQSFSNAIEDLVMGGGSAREVIAGLLQDFARLILKVGVLEPMMAKLRATMGSGGTTPPNPFAAGSGGGIDWGGIISSFIGGSFANGGFPPVGKASIVGERGPELFVPRTAGMIVPNHALGGGQRENLTIVNQTTGRIDKVVEQRISPTERALFIQEAADMVAAGFDNPNSRQSRALARNTTAGRKR